MKFYISYFYAVRFFDKSAVCLSTGHSDPAWFHDGQGKRHVFRDKRGVMNGLRAEPFVPHVKGECGYCDKDSSKCGFLRNYREQLDKLDFNEMMQRFESIAARVSPNVDNPDIILLVWEAPDNPCSERWVLSDWFKDHGVQIEEYPILEKSSVKPKRQEVYNF